MFLSGGDFNWNKKVKYGEPTIAMVTNSPPINVENKDSNHSHTAGQQRSK